MMFLKPFVYFTNYIVLMNQGLTFEYDKVLIIYLMSYYNYFIISKTYLCYLCSCERNTLKKKF